MEGEGWRGMLEGWKEVEERWRDGGVGGGGVEGWRWEEGCAETGNGGGVERRVWWRGGGIEVEGLEGRGVEWRAVPAGIDTEPNRKSAILSIPIPLKIADVSVSIEPPDYNHANSAAKTQAVEGVLPTFHMPLRSS